MDSFVRDARYHYMDNLRALAMMTGIFFHAALAYSPFMAHLWLSADTGNIWALDCLAWFTHLFRMPLFFFIAGYFAHHLILKRGVRGFLKNRSERILLPFIVFLPITILTLVGVVFYASSCLGIHTTLLDFVVNAIRGWPNEGAHFSTSHLWFLYSLLWFCSFAALFYRFIPLNIANNRLFKSPLFIFCILPFALVPSMLTQMTPFPAPDRIFPELWAFGFFGVFFFLGWVFYFNQQWLVYIEKYWLLLSVLCAAAYAVYYSKIPSDISLDEAFLLLRNSKPLSGEGLISALAAAFVSLYATLLCLLVGYKFFDKQSPKLRYVADASYWVYLIHLPLLLFIQMHLMLVQWPLIIKYLLGVVGTIAIGMLSYALFVRGRPIGRMLNGR